MKAGRMLLCLLGSFLILSVSGCGKQETAESLAEKPESTPSSLVSQVERPQEVPATTVSQQAEEERSNAEAAPDATPSAASAEDESTTTQEGAEAMLQMKIGETPVAVEWEENESVQALKELCRETPLTIEMAMYGGFEQVGSIGQSLPRNDVQTTTEAGDIVLYSGNQMVVFYGSNAWAYTRLGHITDQDAAGMAGLLGNGNVTITLWA